MIERCPLPRYTTGWFQIGYTVNLEAGGVTPVKAFGEDLVLFRDENGEAKVFDAFCPHLGAHLGYGGKVEGDSIRCPFHGWRFNGEGTCVEIPYGKRIPKAATIRPWHTSEKNGLIMVWYDADGAEPAWEIPDVPEYGDDEWTTYECRSWKIRAHNQEMAENSVDKAHFHFVHGALTVPETTTTLEGPRMKVHSVMKMGTPAGEVDGVIESDAWGFGFSAVRFKGIVDTLLVTSVTPVDDEYVEARFAFSVKKIGNRSTTAGVGAALIADIEKQMSEDIPIWENKVFHDRPVLCDGDGPIGQFRTWARQFYPEAA